MNVCRYCCCGIAASPRCHSTGAWFCSLGEESVRTTPLTYMGPHHSTAVYVCGSVALSPQSCVGRHHKPQIQRHKPSLRLRDTPPTPTPICQRSQGKLPPSAAPYAGWSQRNTSVYTPPLPLSFPAVVNGWHPSAFRTALSGVSHVARRLRGGVRRRRPGGVRAAEYVPALRCEAAPSRRRRTPAPPRGGPARRRTGRRQPWPACTAASAGAVSRVRRSRRRRNGWTDGGTDTDRSDAELETSGERRRWCV